MMKMSTFLFRFSGLTFIFGFVSGLLYDVRGTVFAYSILGAIIGVITLFAALVNRSEGE